MNKIKMIRIERNIKGRDLADKAKITPAYLSIIENGRLPSGEVKRNIAKALGLPIKAVWS